MRKQQILSRLREPEPNTLFLTVTISSRLNSKPPKYQFAATYYEVKKVLDMFARDYCMNIECTLDGNLHYHAWVQMRSLNARPPFMVRLKKSKTLGFIKINKEPITDTKRVYNYMLDIDNDKKGANISMAYDLLESPYNEHVVTNYTPLIDVSIPLTYDYHGEESSLN